MKSARTWYVEDVHDQTGLYLKAYKNKPEGIATVKVVEETEEKSKLPEKTATVFYNTLNDSIVEGPFYFFSDSKMEWLVFTDQDGSVEFLKKNEWIPDHFEFIGEVE